MRTSVVTTHSERRYRWSDETCRLRAWGWLLRVVLISVSGCTAQAPPDAPTPIGQGHTAAANAIAPRLWPGGVLYYEMGAWFSGAMEQQLLTACADWGKTAPIRCERRTAQENYVIVGRTYAVLNESGHSPVGMVGGPQDLAVMPLSPYSTWLHEVGHALGRMHEHQRPDRDMFIEVRPEFATPQYKAQLSRLEFETYAPYDFASVMHYGSHAYSASWSGEPTIVPRPGYEAYADVMGAATLSDLDREAIRAMYERAREDEVTPEIKLIELPHEIQVDDYLDLECIAADSSGIAHIEILVEGEHYLGCDSDPNLPTSFVPCKTRFYVGSKLARRYINVMCSAVDMQGHSSSHALAYTYVRDR